MRQQEMLSNNPAAIEARARRAARRFGYIIKKSRSRTESLDNFGGYMLVDPYINGVVDGLRFDLSAEDIIEFCTESAGTAGHETATNGAQEGVALGTPKPVNHISASKTTIGGMGTSVGEPQKTVQMVRGV